MKKQLCCLLLALCLLAAASPSPLMAEPVSLPAVPDSGSVWDGSFVAPSVQDTWNGVDYYIISSCSELAYVAVEGGEWLSFNYLLNADLIINDVTLTWDENGDPAISVKPLPPIAGIGFFCGVFEGNYHTISGLIISTDTDRNAGLFGTVNDSGVIRNLTVTNSYIRGGESLCTGGIAGNCTGKIENCRFSGHVKGEGSDIGGVAGYGVTVSHCENHAEIWGNNHYVGGVAGRASYIYGCANYGSVHGYGNCTGGIAGNTSVGSTVDNCDNYGEVFASDYYSKGDYVGGIVGNCSGSIRSCSNTALICGSQYIGGIAGQCSGNITDCCNSGQIMSNKGTVGGVAGRADGAVDNCRNSGVVEIADTAQGSCSKTGGVVGNLGHKASASCCVNEGEVHGCGDAGGIAGTAYGNISECSNSAAVYSQSPPNRPNESPNNAGGIAGACGESVSILRCANRGKVVGMYYVGGIAGTMGAEMSDCCNSGDVAAYSYAGGLAAGSYGSAPKMSRCYSAGTVWFRDENKYSSIGAILGYDSSSYPLTASDCYYCPQQASGLWNAFGSVSDSVPGCTAVSDADLKNRFTFSGWDFYNIWAISPNVNNGYPYLAWEKLPSTPPPEDPNEDAYRVNSVTARSADGNALSCIPNGSFLATVSVTKLTEGSDAMVILAAYSSDGAYCGGLMFFSVEDVPSGGTVKVTLPVNNADGHIAVLKAFPVSSFGDLTPLGAPASFPN